MSVTRHRCKIPFLKLPGVLLHCALSIIITLLAVQNVVGAAELVNPTEQDLIVELDHVFISPGQGGLDISENLILVNKSSAVLGETAVGFLLPEGYSSLVYGLGIPVDRGWVEEGQLKLSLDLPPGETSIGFKYRLASEVPHYNFVHAVSLPVSFLYIVSPPEGLDLDSSDLTDAGVQTIGEQQFHLLAASDLAAGQKTGVRVTVLPPGTSSVPDSSGIISRQSGPSFHNPGHIRFWYQSPFKGINAHIFLLIAVALPIVALAWWISQRSGTMKAFTRRRDLNEPGIPEDALFERLYTREKILLKKIVELDRLYELKQITLEEHQEAREAYKRRLVEIKGQLRSLT